jgi:hypothetical protein
MIHIDLATYYSFMVVFSVFSHSLFIDYNFYSLLNETGYLVKYNMEANEQ